MATFGVKRVKYGFVGERISEYISIDSITCDEGDEVIVLPSEFEGEPITHFGYGQAFEEAHEVWADWHHPGKGSVFVPDKYHFTYPSFKFPKSVKKIVIPATVVDISSGAKEAMKSLIIEVSPENPHYRYIDGKLIWQ